MEEQEFLEKSAKLFLQYGAKTLTMDDIAREFGMSKKTLYQKYKNKEALLEDVLAYKLEEVINKIEKVETEVDNAVERMFCRDEQMENAMESNQSVFIRQLVKYYPRIFENHITRFADKFSDVLARNIERGRKQGYYREGFDAKLYAKFLFQMMISYDSSPVFDSETINRADFHHAVLVFYMNAITTEKGKEFIG